MRSNVRLREMLLFLLLGDQKWYNVQGYFKLNDVVTPCRAGRSSVSSSMTPEGAIVLAIVIHSCVVLAALFCFIFLLQNVSLQFLFLLYSKNPLVRNHIS